MGQDVRRRKQATITFSANNEKQEPIGRGMVYRELYLRLRGAATLTDANNTQAKLKKGDEWGVVKRIEIVANNTEVIWSVSGNQLWWLNMFFFNSRPPITPGLGDASTANAPFDSTLILPFWMARSVRPIDTALDARMLSDLKVRIAWGTYTDINGDASAWTTEPYVDVHSLECIISGKFATQKIYQQEIVVPATNTAFQVTLPVGDMYRGFLINTEVDGVDNISTLNNFKIKSGTTIFADIPAAILRQMDSWQRIGCGRSFDAGAGASGLYDEARRGTTYNKLNAWYLYDHVTDGRLTECIDTLGFSEFQLELDVTKSGTTTKLFVLPWTMIPVRGK
jgi:hypothetical protein